MGLSQAQAFLSFPTRRLPSQAFNNWRRKCFLQLAALHLPLQIKLAVDGDTFPFHAGLINVSPLIVWRIPALWTARPDYCSGHHGCHVKTGAGECSCTGVKGGASWTGSQSNTHFFEKMLLCSTKPVKLLLKARLLPLLFSPTLR